MRYAIIIENEKILVEFSEGDFIKLLKYYLNRFKDIDKAIEETRRELLNKVRKI